MSILSIKLDTEDRNVVCEVADMLRRLIATEADYGYGKQCKCGDVFPPQAVPAPLTPEGLSASMVLTEEETAYVTHVSDNLPPAVDTAAVFAAPLTPFEQSLTGVPIPPAPMAHVDVPALPTADRRHVAPAAADRRGATLDSEGLPWDRRIHASTKTFRQSDNTWKLIRGITEEKIAEVKAELRAAMAAPPAPAAPSGLPDMDDDKSWPVPPAAPVPVPPTLTLVPPPPPAPPAPPEADPFPEFVQFCTSSQQSGKLAYQTIVDTCGKYGITQLPMLNARHDLIPTIRAELESLCSK